MPSDFLWGSARPSFERATECTEVGIAEQERDFGEGYFTLFDVLQRHIVPHIIHDFTETYPPVCKATLQGAFGHNQLLGDPVYGGNAIAQLAGHKIADLIDEVILMILVFYNVL